LTAKIREKAAIEGDNYKQLRKVLHIWEMDLNKILLQPFEAIFVNPL
jgi:hypothetical protein